MQIQQLSFTDRSVRKCHFYEADMSLSVRIDNKNKDILILGEKATQGLDDNTLTAEAK